MSKFDKKVRFLIFPDFEVFQSGRILETRYSKKDNMEKSLADMNFAKISEIFEIFKIF